MYVLTFLLYAILEFYILVSGVGYYCIKMLKDFLICAGLRKLRISSYTATASTQVEQWTLKHGNILFLLSGLFDD
jgi:hypothetical protein